MLRRLISNARGVVAVEFAICVPVLLLMFLGTYVASDMIQCSRKVTIASRELADLVSRNISPSLVYNNPGSISATQYLSASAVVMSPYNLAKSTEQISLLRVCDATHAYVVWTQAQTQSADGSKVTATTSTQTAGTVPKYQTQSANTVVSIPSNMITAPMIPSSPDGSNVCKNLDPGTSNTTQVGTAGGWLYMGRISYSYTPAISYHKITTDNLVEVIYMSPRLS